MNQSAKWTLVDTFAVIASVCLVLVAVVGRSFVIGVVEEFELEVSQLTQLFLNSVFLAALFLGCILVLAAFVTIRLLAGAKWLGVLLLVLSLLGNVLVAFAFALPLWQMMSNLS